MGKTLFLMVLLAAACAPDSHDAQAVAAGAPLTQPAGETAESATDKEEGPIESRIPVPPSFERIGVSQGSFGAWLRRLPLRPGRPAVHLYDGRLKANQSAHYAVLEMDVGEKDLQQCADAVMRLRAEYLFAGPCADDIEFDFTSGDAARWREWREGMRPRVSGNGVSWNRTAAADGGYASFRSYLETVFTYAGSASLERELEPVADPAHPEIGDVFIEGGFPGHAVLVVDVAENGSAERIFLLAQSYMPAQDIHILRSFADISPWYRARAGGVLRTPEWEFDFAALRRFPRRDCAMDGGETAP